MKPQSRTVRQALAQARNSKRPSSIALIDFNRLAGKSGNTHTKLFKAAAALHYYGVPSQDAQRWLYEKYCEGYSELRATMQINRVMDKIYNNPRKITFCHNSSVIDRSRNKRRKIKLTAEIIIANITEVISYDTHIPEPSDKFAEMCSADFILGIYDSKRLVCSARDLYSPSTRKIENQIYDINSSQFIVANPMRKRSGRTQEGNISARCKDNATRTPKLLVYECDTVRDLKKQKKIIFFLASIFPLVISHESGNKSIHAWFRVSGKSVVEKAKQLLIALGGDPMSLYEWQLVRTPNGFRPVRVEKNKIKKIRQKVIFYDKSNFHSSVNMKRFNYFYKKFVLQKGGASDE
jgi:hypothetical protein